MKTTILNVRIAVVARFGIPQVQPIHKYIAGAQSVLLKNSPGNLHKVAINSNTGTRIIIYDGLNATGSIIASINPNQLATLDYGQLTFSNGLYVVTTGATIDCTITYE